MDSCPGRVPTWAVPLVLAVMIVGEQPAQAYVDPGSASYVFQLAVGGVLGFLYLVRTYWAQVTGFVRTRIRARDAGD